MRKELLVSLALLMMVSSGMALSLEAPPLPGDSADSGQEETSTGTGEISGPPMPGQESSESSGDNGSSTVNSSDQNGTGVEEDVKNSDKTGGAGGFVRSVFRFVGGLF